MWNVPCIGVSVEVSPPVRLLVLDGSRVLHILVVRLAPPDVEVETVQSFQDALTILRYWPPDGVIVNVAPTPLAWREIKRVCHRHDPPIPVLFESCVYKTPQEAGIGELGSESTFLTKPYPLERLREEITRLVSPGVAVHS